MNGTQRVLVSVNHGSFVSFVRNQAIQPPHTLLFPSVLGESLECDVVPAFLAPGLLQEYPFLVSWTGLCTGESSVTLTYDLNIPGSLDATFFTNGQVVRVHSDKQSSNGELYVIRRWRDREVHPDFKFITKEPPQAEEENFLPRFLSGDRHLKQILDGLSVPPEVNKAYKFRIAFLVTQPFVTKLEANSKADVISYLVNILARINGIFLRELGVFFELIEEIGQIICLGEDPPGCQDWTDEETSAFRNLTAPASTSSQLVLQVGDLITAAGVDSSAYEIGHALYDLEDQFGLAFLGVVCRDIKALGVSGVGGLNISLTSDNFVVDLLAHELGHQLLGSHTFNYCPQNPSFEEGFDFGPYSIPATAYEPGSGVTIMSYAVSIDVISFMSFLYMFHPKSSRSRQTLGYMRS